MKINLNVKKIEFSHILVERELMKMVNSFDDIKYNYNDLIPRYYVPIDITITYEGVTFIKTYNCYYYGMSFPYHKKMHFIYKTWTVEQPYLSFPTLKENQKNKRKIKKALCTLLDEIEKKEIFELERKNIPFISKINITSIEAGFYHVEFHFSNFLGRYGCFVQGCEEYSWDINTLLRYTKRKQKAVFRPKSVFWEDHIFEQVVEIIRTKTKNRIRYVSWLDKQFKYEGFVPSHYPLGNVKITYK